MPSKCKYFILSHATKNVITSHEINLLIIIHTYVKELKLSSAINFKYLSECLHFYLTNVEEFFIIKK